MKKFIVVNGYAALILMVFGATEGVYSQNARNSYWVDNIFVSLAVGTSPFVKLQPGVSSPLQLLGRIEAAYQWPVGKQFALSTGLGLQSDRIMVNGQFKLSANEGALIFQRADQEFTENYYAFTALTAPVSWRVLLPGFEENRRQFLGIGIRANFLLSALHHYNLGGDSGKTDVLSMTKNFQPSAFLEFGELIKSKRGNSTLLNFFGAEIGIDIRPLDDAKTRRAYLAVKIGI